MGDELDPKFIRQMARPIKKKEWKTLLRAHQQFIRHSRFGHWQILTVAGLPMPFWGGEAGEGQIALSMKDLSNLDLKFAKLTRAALVGVIGENLSFRGINFINGLMTDSFLDGADFSMGRLEDADFSRSSLRGAKFVKANLTGADFQNCDLTGADFTGAKLDRTKFLYATLDDVIGFDYPIYSGDPREELAQIFEHFEGWVIGNEYEQFILRHDEPTLMKELCDALKADPDKFGRDTDIWNPFTAKSAVAFFGADDVLRLVAAIAKGAPEGKIIKSWGSINLWNESDIPGRPFNLVSIFNHKNESEDEAFFDEFNESLDTLAEPYQTGLRSLLVEMGCVNVD